MGGHELKRPRERGTLRFTLEPEFLGKIDLGPHYFRDYGQTLICFFYFVEVTGTAG